MHDSELSLAEPLLQKMAYSNRVCKGTLSIIFLLVLSLACSLLLGLVHFTPVGSASEVIVVNLAAKMLRTQGVAMGYPRAPRLGVSRTTAMLTATPTAVAAVATELKSPFDPVVIEKPSTDYRQYKSVQLANNLQVVLVSDPKCDRSAAALSVNVGSIFDPPEIPGLAHFLEHMLFLGTEKYPEEDEYNSYLARNGGDSNAYTAETVTNYFFSVKPDAFDGALDRFAQFFIAPIFNASATDRELQAVDSEHSKNVQQDMWRQMQLLRNGVNPSHPLNHFGTGNIETLRDAPARKGVDVRTALLDFHARYYSANLMRLVVVGREDPEALLQMINSRFSPIVNRNANVLHDKEIGQGITAFPPDRLMRVVYVVPVNDLRSAEFYFLLPGLKKFWRSKPSRYLSHLLGHEGAGSLLTALKRRNLATELSAGEAMDEAGIHAFKVTIMLTEAGEADIATVGDLLFSYIQLMREAGPNEKLWRELQTLSDIGFRFRPLSDSLSTASDLAHNLQEYAPEVALSAGMRLWEYDPSPIQDLLEQMRPNNLRLELSSKAYTDRCQSEERWYGTKFSDEAIDPKLCARWEVASGFADLKLPTPNPFVPDDLELRHYEQGTHPAYPCQLEHDPTSATGSSANLHDVTTVYFRKDEEFGLPKAVCAFNMYCPFVAESMQNRQLSRLWCMGVEEELNEFAYEAQVAGLSYSLQAREFGMQLTVGGYTDKMPMLLAAVSKKMSNLYQVPEQTYNLTRTILERNLNNDAANSPPYLQAYECEQCLVQSGARSNQERLQVVRTLGGHEVLEGINRKLLDRCHVECLLQGNFVADEAKGLVRSFIEPLGISQPLDSLPPVGTANLPPGWTLLERKGTNPEESNGAIIVRLQAGPYSLAGQCLVALTDQILGQRFFDELRTKQQLGYLVSASSFVERFGFVGLRFFVQSMRRPDEVLQRVHAWMQDSWDFLETDLEETQFQEYRAAVIAKLKERPKTLNEEFGRNWREVDGRSLEFQTRQMQIEYLETLTLDDLRSFVSQKLRNAPACCVLVSAAAHGESQEAAVPALAADRRWDLEDVAAFRCNAQWSFRPAEINRSVT